MGILDIYSLTELFNLPAARFAPIQLAKIIDVWNIYLQNLGIFKANADKYSIDGASGIFCVGFFSDIQLACGPCPSWTPRLVLNEVTLSSSAVRT